MRPLDRDRRPLGGGRLGSAVRAACLLLVVRLALPCRACHGCCGNVGGGEMKGTTKPWADPGTDQTGFESGDCGTCMPPRGGDPQRGGGSQQGGRRGAATKIFHTPGSPPVRHARQIHGYKRPVWRDRSLPTDGDTRCGGHRSGRVPLGGGYDAAACRVCCLRCCGVVVF